VYIISDFFPFVPFLEEICMFTEPCVKEVLLLLSVGA
jgi:hypothetical protein